MSLELNSKRLYQSSGKEKESRCLVVHVHYKTWNKAFSRWVVQRRQKNVRKSVMHVQSCCFVNLNLLLFCRSCCCRLRRCLSSPIINKFQAPARVAKHFGAGGTALTDRRRDQGRASPWGLGWRPCWVRRCYRESLCWKMALNWVITGQIIWAAQNHTTWHKIT